MAYQSTINQTKVGYDSIAIFEQGALEKAKGEVTAGKA